MIISEITIRFYHSETTIISICFTKIKSGGGIILGKGKMKQAF